jgi:hypothetical protein
MMEQKQFGNRAEAQHPIRRLSLLRPTPKLRLIS